MDNIDLQHYNQSERYVKAIKKQYQALINEVSRLTALYDIDTEKPFNFDDYPALKKEVDIVLNDFANTTTSIIEIGKAKQWEMGVKKVMQYLPFAHKNLLNYQDSERGLSDRVWKLTSQYKGELEMALDLGIGSGKSANAIAREIKQYLNEPDRLFRKVRDKHGNLHLSQKAKEYHSGQGVYRSSYKNAQRLARTETNRAYHTAIYEKYQEFDFIVGIQVRLSNNPKHCPFCAAMAGKYPKDFKFTGWHPNCRCTTIPILAKDIDNVEESEKIKELHKPFADWLEENQEKIKTAKSKPYFIRDNEKLLNKETYAILYKNTIFTKNLAELKKKAHLPNMDIEKINAINLYTGNYYRDINRYLREQRHTIDENIGLNKKYYEAITKTINSGLDDLPKYQGTTYRATNLPNEVLQDYKKAFESGKPYTDKAFFSTSYTKGILDHPSYAGNVEFEVISKKGVNIENIAMMRIEREVLFKAGTRFRVVDFEKGNKMIKIKLEEL